MAGILHPALMHKALFPSTVYQLNGLIEADNHLCAIIEQPWVRVTRGTKKEEVSNFLLPLGCVNTKFNDYYNNEYGIILEDLHDENVFIGTEDNLLFVNPVIYLETPDLGLGGKSQFLFPFNEDFL